jgi:hypothetical protein
MFGIRKGNVGRTHMSWNAVSSHGELDSESTHFHCENLFSNEVYCADAKIFQHEYDVPRKGRIPLRKAILKRVDNFSVHGNVLPSACHRIAEQVPAVMQQNPTCSVRWPAAADSSRFLQIILHKDLKFHPYKVHIALELDEQDNTSHMNFCRQFLDLLDNVEGIWDVLIMSDEAHFHLPSYVIKQNFRYLSDNNLCRWMRNFSN